MTATSSSSFLNSGRSLILIALYLYLYHEKGKALILTISAFPFSNAAYFFV